MKCPHPDTHMMQVHGGAVLLNEQAKFELSKGHMYPHPGVARLLGLQSRAGGDTYSALTAYTEKQT